MDKDFTKINGYVFSKLIFRVVIFVMVILFLCAFFTDGPNGFLVTCSKDALGGSCQNPYFVNCSSHYDYACSPPEYLPVDYKYLMDYEFLPAGFKVGREAGWIQKNFFVLTLILIAGGLLLNHLLYNKNFKFRR